MRRMFVHEGLGRITTQELRHNEESDVLLTIKGLLQNMTAVTVRS